MEWQMALNRMLDATAPIHNALHSGVVQSAEEAFTHPALTAARQAIVGELRKRATIDELITASAELRRQHEELLLKPDLTPEELQQLGVLSGLALVLSARALEQKLSERDCFQYAVTQLGPWLHRAAGCGVLRANQHASALAADAASLFHRMTKTFACVLPLTFVLLCGCGAQLRSAAYEHAEASRAVAMTLKRVSAGLHCETLKDDAAATCKVQATVIEDQAQALQDSAERLRRAAR